jgi:hypothetical protein
MTSDECEYSRNISLAIQRSNEAANHLRCIVEDSRKAGNDEAVKVFSETKLIDQNAIVDLIRLRRDHQTACPECLGLSKA